MSLEAIRLVFLSAGKVEPLIVVAIPVVVVVGQEARILDVRRAQEEHHRVVVDALVLREDSCSSRTRCFPRLSIRIIFMFEVWSSPSSRSSTLRHDLPRPAARPAPTRWRTRPGRPRESRASDGTPSRRGGGSSHRSPSTTRASRICSSGGLLRESCRRPSHALPSADTRTATPAAERGDRPYARRRRPVIRSGLLRSGALAIRSLAGVPQSLPVDSSKPQIPAAAKRAPRERSAVGDATLRHRSLRPRGRRESRVGVLVRCGRTMWQDRRVAHRRAPRGPIVRKDRLMATAKPIVA